MITVRDLHKTYRSGESAVRALRGVDMTIADGEFLAVAGPSGSGKSTLLNIIGCLDRPDGGSVSIDEREMAELDARGRADYRRENLGFVFQSFNLIPVLTAYENVAFSLHLLNVPQGEIKERTSSILREVGLAGMENRRPSRLSGGQQSAGKSRQISICRYGDPANDQTPRRGDCNARAFHFLTKFLTK